MPEYIYVNHMYASVCASKKEISGPLELELQAIVRFFSWVLRIEPGSSAKSNN